jgi:recombinational DNA repair protein RecR
MRHADIRDVMAIEHGANIEVYHVLGGKISPVMVWVPVS